jgi:hypothetical protein
MEWLTERKMGKRIHCEKNCFVSDAVRVKQQDTNTNKRQQVRRTSGYTFK